MANYSAFDSNNISIPTLSTNEITTPQVAETPLQLKQAQILDKTIDKAQNSKFTKDTLLGMDDADSFTTQNLGDTRNRTDVGYYDAVELAHKEGADVKGYVEGNKYKAQVQPQLVSEITGKPIDQLTTQDYIDVGNMQQIQKLSDLARSKGQDRWQAPFVPNVGQVDLTGQYTDEFGKPVNAPLNIPIGTREQGQGKYGRTLTDVLNPQTGINVTEEATLDPRLNASYGQAAFGQAKFNGPEVPYIPYVQKNSLLENTAKSAVAEGIKFITDTADVVGDLTSIPIQSITEATGKKIEDVIVPLSYAGYGIDENTGKLEHKWFNNGEEAAAELTGYQKELQAPATKKFTTTIQSIIDNKDMSRLDKSIEIGKAAYEAKETVPEAVVKSLAYLAHIANPVTFAATVAGESNIAFDERNKERKDLGLEEDTLGDKAGVVAITTGKVALDKVIDKIIFSGKSVSGTLKNKLIGATAKTSDSITKNAVGRLLKGSLVTAESGATEYVTEGIQTAMEIYAKKFDTDMIKDEALAANFTDKEWQQIRDGAAIGALTGTGQSAAGQVVSEVAGGTLGLAAKKNLESKVKKLAEKQRKQEATAINPAKAAKQASSKEERENAATLKVKNQKTVDFINKGLDLDLDTMSEKNLNTILKGVDTIDDNSDIDIINAVDKIKKKVSKKLSESTVKVDNLTLGSEAEAEVFIEELYANAEDADSTILEENIQNIASKFGLSKKKVTELKTAAQVEYEASKGVRGYNTYNRDLKRLMVDPKKNAKAIEAKKEQLYYFEETQVDRLDRMERAIDKIERDVKSGDFKNGTRIVKYATGGDFKIHVKDGVINPAAIAVVSDIKKTISGINKVYADRGLDKDTEFTLDTKIRVPKYSKAKRALSNARRSVIKQLDSGLTIYMNSASGKGKIARSKWEKGIAAPLYKLGINKKDGTESKYVEVDSDGDISGGSGRWVLRKNAKPAKTNVKHNKSKTEYIARKVNSKEKLNKDEQEYFDNFNKEVMLEAEDLFYEGKTETVLEIIVEKMADKLPLNTIEKLHVANLPTDEKLNLDDYVAELIEERENEPVKPTKRSPKEILTETEEALVKLNKEIGKLRKEKLAEPNDLKKLDIQDKLDTLTKQRNKLNTTKKAITGKTVTQHILDTSISKGMEPIGQGKGSMEQTLDINQIVTIKDDSKSLVGSNELTDSTPETVEVAAIYYKLLRKVLAPVKEKKDGTLHTAENYALKDSPSRGLIFNNKHEVNKSTAAALGIAMTEYMALGGAALSYRTKADIAQMLGLREPEVSQEAYEFFRDKGMVTKNAAYDIGRNALNILGLKENESIPEEIYYKLVADFGHAAILSEIENGNIEFSIDKPIYSSDTEKFTESTGIKANKYNEMAFGKEAAAQMRASEGINDKTTVSMIRYTTKGKDAVETNKLTFEEIQEEVGVESQYKTGGHKKPVSKPDNREIRNNEVTEQSDAAVKVLEELRSTEYTANSSALNWISKNTDLAKKYLGYIDEESDEFKELTYNSKESTLAKNEVYDRSIEFLEEIEPGDEKMFFDWFYSKNSRYMLDSNTLNPQNDTLHRFIIVPSEHEITNKIDGIGYTKKGDTLSELDLFKFSVAQAFGMSTDKKNTLKVLDFGQKVLDIGSVELQKMLDSGKFKDDIEVEHLGHYLQGLEAIKAYEEANLKGLDTFTHSLSMESDAVTSGFGIRLMQMPIIKNAHEWLAKTGFFVNKNVESMNDEIDTDNFFDSYQELAKDVTPDKIEKPDGVTKSKFKSKQWDYLIKEFTAMLPQLDDDGSVSKDLRQLFKDPFMTFNYSRGIGSIMRGLGSIIANDIMNELVKPVERGSKEAALLTKLKKIYGKDLVKRLKTEPASRILPENKALGKMSIEEYLTDMGKNTYGQVAANSLSENFKEFIEANETINNSFKAMFQVYKLDYDAAIAAEEKKTGNGATSKRKLEIIQGLRNKFPLIKGPYSTKKDLSDALVIVSDTHKVPEYNYGSASTKLADNKTKKVQSRIKEFEQAISAGSVVPIHALDGALMGNTILQNAGVASIHDAIIPPLNTTNKTVADYNQEAVDVNKNYSITHELLESMKRVAKDDGTIVISIKNGDGTISKYPLSKLVEDVAVLNGTVSQARSELYSQNIDVVHMAAVPGSKYEYKGEVQTSVQNTGTGVKEAKKNLQITKDQAQDIKKIILDAKGKLRKAVQNKVDAFNKSKIDEDKIKYTDYRAITELLLKSTGQAANQIKTIMKGKTLGSEQTSNVNFDTDVNNLKIGALKSVEGMKNVIETLDDTNLDKGYKKYVLGLLDEIDPQFLPDLNLYINKEADKNAGMIDNNNIIINASPVTLINTAEMTSTEVYVHELMHAITKYAVENVKKDPTARKLVRQIEHLRDVAEKHITPEMLMAKQPLDKKKELELATKRWKYIFENENSLHEFIAHGMTNPRMMKELQKLTSTDLDEATTLWGQLKNLGMSLINIILGNTQYTTTKGTVKSELKQLVFELMNVNNKAVNTANREAPLLGGVSRFINKYGNAPVSKLINYITDKAAGDPDNFTPKPTNGSTIENFIWAIKHMTRVMLDDKLAHHREAILKAFGNSPEGFIQNILRDFQKPSDLERIIEKLGMSADMIDQARELIVSEARSSIYDKFNKDLTKTHKEAITLSGLDLDLESIYDTYSSPELQRLLRDPEVLKKEISKVKTQMKRLDTDNFNWNITQSTGLGYYLATHQAGLAQNLNATNIAIGILSGERRSLNKNLVNKIDQLSTLIGIQNTAPESNGILADLIQTEKKGMDYVMKLSKSIKKESKDKLFDTDATMIKGYTKQIFDETVDIRIWPIEEDEIGDSRDGFELMYNLSADDVDGNSKPMGVYKSKYYINSTYNRTATRMTSMIKRGTSIKDMARALNEGESSLTEREAVKEVRRIKKEAVKEANAMKSGEFTFNPTNTLTPVLDPYGNIVDYRYTMKKDLKKELLNQNTEVGEVLARTLGSIQDKVDTSKQNEAVLKVILSDMNKEYDPDTNYGKNNGKEYVRIEEKSDIAVIREIYRILPPAMKHEIKNNGKGYIAVRRDMLHNYFGFRDGTLLDFIPLVGKAIQEIAPWLDKLIRIAESLWKDIVAISKVDIIIRTPAVFIGNIISNAMYSITMGASPVKVLRAQLDNSKNTRKYIENQQKIARLKVEELGSSKSNKAMIKRIEAEQKKNPVHELMEAGMYQAIAEDVDKRELKSTNRLVRRVEEFSLVETMPEFVKTGVNWLYLNENTKYFEFMTKATQYSDFIARATEYQLLLEKGIPKKQAQDTVLDVFINYGKPASSFEEYLNDVGLIMFTKYAKRIQRVIQKSGKEKPVNVLLSIFGQEMIMGMDDIWDQHPLVRSYSNIGISPFEHLGRAATPTSLQFLGLLD